MLLIPRTCNIYESNMSSKKNDTRKDRQLRQACEYLYSIKMFSLDLKIHCLKLFWVPYGYIY